MDVITAAIIEEVTKVVIRMAKNQGMEQSAQQLEAVLTTLREEVK